VRVAGHLRGQQRRLQFRGPVGEGVDAFVQVVIRGGLTDRVVGGQLRQPGAVEKPAQNKHRLGETGQGAGAATGAAPQAFGMQQA
jgi:hypothetical protein